MPIFVAKFDSCDCIPIPDFVFRADDMVSAVIKCQEVLDRLEKEIKDSHSIPTIDAIEQMPFEIMDEEGVSDVLEFLRDCVEK
jgi:hypothetical protein